MENNNRISGNSNNSNNNNSTSTTNRQSYKRTFSESDTSSRTERCLCSFSHLWIINYLSSYIEDSNSTCLQSECFSPVNTPYSNTRWSLKLYPRGLNEKQHTTTNNHIAIFLKYISGTMMTIKAKAEFSVVSRNNELVMLRSTNFHTFSSGNDWGYSEFLDGNYLNSRRNDLLIDDRLRVYVRVILVDEKETITNDLFHHPSQILLPPPPPPPPPSSLLSSQQQTNSNSKTQASASSSLASSSSGISITNPNLSNPSSTSTSIISSLFPDDKERLKSYEILSNQMKILLDNERFTDVHIHVLPKQNENIKLNRIHDSSCQCSNNNNNEQSLSVISKDSETNNSSQLLSTRRTTRSISLLSRISHSSDCSTSSDTCSLSSYSKQCLCSCHDQDNYNKYSQITPLITFYAHKVILLARSSSFANQIRLKTLTELSQNIKSPPMNIYIDDLEPSTIRAMLIYIYTGRLPTTNDDLYNNLNPIDLFRASIKYNLTELRDLSKSTMLDILKIDNAIEMLIVSDQANDYSLKQQILSFIRSNASTITKTSNWINFTKNNPQLLIDAFRSLVTPTITKHSNNHHHHHHSTSLTTTSISKYSKSD